jgi:ATP-dependent protease ClpP protease subunit
MLKLLALLTVFATPDAATTEAPAPVQIMTPVPVQTPAQKTSRKCIRHPCVTTGSLSGEIGASDIVSLMEVLTIAGEAGADAIAYDIDSIGGNFDAARSIFKIIKASKTPFYCHVSGDAKSSAFWVLQACKERATEPDAMLLVHPIFFVGHDGQFFKRHDLVTMISDLDVSNEVMFTNIAPRMGITVKALTDRCNQGDWSFSATAALAAHAVDVIFEGGLEAYAERVKSLLKQR